MTSVMTLTEPGTILAGKYRVDRVLGAGGMGVVVGAKHLHLDEPVAIKLMLPEVLGNADAVTRFLREARAAVKIKSEHVARVSDVGVLDTGEPYIVMEYLEGEDLAARVTKRGPLSVEQASEFVVQACEALAEAHCLGIVHRDLKPANLFCIRRADGLQVIKVLDFGISKAATGTSSELGVTKTAGGVMGSPLYMSPEQLESARDVDARGDIWALGVILYELVSGRPPFIADSLPGVILQIASRPAAPLGAMCPGLPAGFEALVSRCLQKRREQRFQNVAELAMALVHFAPRARGSAERAQRVLQVAGQAQPDLVTAGGVSQGETVGATLLSGVGTESTFGNTAAASPLPKRSGKAGLGLGVFAAVLLAVGGGSLRLMTRATADTSHGGSGSLSSAAQNPLPLGARAASASALSALGEGEPAVAKAPLPVESSQVRSSPDQAPPPPPRTKSVVVQKAPTTKSKAAAVTATPAPSPVPVRGSINALIEDRE